MYKRIMSVLICAALVVTGTAALPASAYASGGADPGTIRGAVYQRGSVSNENIETYYYSDDLFRGDSRQYNRSLATFSSYTAGAALTSERPDTKGEGYLSRSRNIRALLEDIGFTDIELSKAYAEPIYDEDTVAVACAHKNITDKGKDYTLLAIIPRSGSYDKEFGSIFRISSGAKDTGDYYNYRQRVDPLFSFTKDYIQKHGISGDIKVWTVGFSGSAGITNLSAAALLDDPQGRLGDQIRLKPGNFYCYTIGTPKVASTGKDLGNSRYDYIHNIADDSDFLAKLPPSMQTGRYGRDYGPAVEGRKEHMLEMLRDACEVDYETFINGDPDDYYPLKVDTDGILSGEIGFVKDDESYLPYDLYSYEQSVLDNVSEIAAGSSKSGNVREGYYNVYQEPLTHFGEVIINRLYRGDTAIIDNLKESATVIPMAVSMYITFIADKYLSDRNARTNEKIEGAFNAMASFIEDENGRVKAEFAPVSGQYYAVRNAFFTERKDPDYVDDFLQKYELKYDMATLLNDRTLRSRMLADQKLLTAKLYSLTLKDALRKSGYDRKTIEILTSDKDSAAISFLAAEVLFGNSYQSRDLDPFSLENEQFKQAATLAGNVSRLSVSHYSTVSRSWLKAADPRYDDFVPSTDAERAGYRRVYVSGPKGVNVSGTVTDGAGKAVASFENGVMRSGSDEWIGITNCDTGNWLRLPLDKDYKVNFRVSKDCRLGLKLCEYSVEEGAVVRTVTGDDSYDWTSLDARKTGTVVLNVPAVEAEGGEYSLASDVYYYVGVTQPKKANPLTVSAKGKPAVVKYRKLKKAAQRVPASSLMTVSGAKGSVSYSKVSVNKRSGSFSVDPATGNVYIKKKTKKGTYRIQIQVTASGDSEYNAGSSTVTCSIKVK